MANLSKNQALALIKEPKNRSEISKAARKKSRHKLHTEVVTDPDHIDDSHQNFLAWVKSIFQSDEPFQRFKAMYRPPVPTNELAESIFSQFERVFESQNGFEQMEFSDNELESDFREYRKRLGDFSFWETKGFETMKSSIDNIVVIDLPKIQRDETGEIIPNDNDPEPYYYILDIARLIDVDATEVSTIDQLTNKPFFYFKIEYLIFSDGPDRACVFDDTFYRTFIKAKDSENWIAEFETPHNLGYCPARSFWTTPLNATTMLQKKGPITGSLTELDWYLYYDVSGKCLKNYAAFPIYAVYKSACGYSDRDRRVRCFDGYLESDGYKAGAPHSSERCPSCYNKIKTGPGNVIEVPVPQDGDDPDLMSNPIKVIPAEEVSIKTVNDELRTKKESIFLACVGEGDDNQGQAKNELQVRGGFESRNSVLLKVKRNFEIIHSFTLETIARLRYGDRFKSLTINYGDQFFVKDEDAEIEQYKTAKEQGLPETDLSLRRDKINEARYRNNPDLLERVKILNNLDPFPNMDIKGAIDISKSNPSMVSDRDLYYKINFARLITKFEREQINILTFGNKIPFDKKIAIIQGIIMQYVDAELKERAPKSIPPTLPA